MSGTRMAFTMDDIKRVLGKRFDKYSEFSLETLASSGTKEIAGFDKLKEVLNETPDGIETMVLMGKPIRQKTLFDRIRKQKN